MACYVYDIRRVGDDHFGKQPSRLDDDNISLFSNALSHNTGFTGGTGAFAGRFSTLAKYRVLERGLDDYIIKHIVARGKKTQAPNGRWTFEKDGIVVVATSGTPDLTVVTAGPIDVSFRLEDGMRAARDAYASLLDELASALDDDDRLHVLLRICKGDEQDGEGVVSRVFHGIDLATRPRNRPLLLHCANEGYTKCVKVLLASGFPVADVAGTNSCNALHMAGWGGHVECVAELCAMCPSLAKSENKWNEFPELAAFSRSCELRFTEEMDAERFEDAAVQCLRTRKGNDTLGLEWFRDEAGKAVVRGFQDASTTVKIPAGARPCDIISSSKLVTSGWRVKKLQADFVELQGCVIQQLLVACSQAKFLTSICFGSCGLGPVELPIIKEFLENLKHPLEKLDLGGNKLGDDIDQVFCPSFFRVYDLGLDNTGMTRTGLCALVKAAEEAITQGALQTTKLRLAQNDLSETGATVEIIASFACMLQQPDCSIREAYLDSTRLLGPQLQLVVDALPKCQLTLLSLHDLSIPESWAAQSQGKLYRALNDPRCQVKKLHVDRAASSQMFDGLWHAIKNRDIAKASLSSGVGGKGRGKAGKQRGTGCVKSNTDERCFSFRDPFCCRLRKLYWDVRREAWLANFVAQGKGVLNGVVLGGTEAKGFDLGQLDLGKGIQVTLELTRSPASVDRDQKAKDLTLKTLAYVDAPVCLEACRLVFFRETTLELLLLRSRVSPAGQELLNLLKFVLPHIHDKTPTQVRPQLCETIEKLSDIELRALIESNDSDFLKEPLEVSSVQNATGSERHQKRVASPTWKVIVGLAEQEEQTRRQQARAVPHDFVRMLSYRPSCQMQSGVSASSQMTYNDPWQAFNEQLDRSVLKGVRIKCCSGKSQPPYVDVVDSSGLFSQRVFFCAIPDKLIDANSETSVPWLLPTAGSAPVWLPSDCALNLGYILQEDLTEGYSALPQAICSFVSSVEVSKVAMVV